MSDNSWLENEEILQRVRDSMADFIYGQQSREGGLFDEQEFKDIREIFNAENPPSTFSAPGDYVASFKRWYANQGYIYHSLKKGASVSVTRQFTLPDGETITLSIGGQFSISDTGAMGRINDGLLNIMESEYSRLLAKMFSGWSPPRFTAQKQITPKGATQLATDEKAIAITHLDTLYQGGRKMVRAFGGEFTKFGIPIYNEALKGLGLKEDEMEVAKQIPVNKTAIVKIKPDGKNPYKIVGWWD